MMRHFLLSLLPFFSKLHFGSLDLERLLGRTDSEPGGGADVEIKKPSPEELTDLILGLGYPRPHPMMEYQEAADWFRMSNRGAAAESLLALRVRRSAFFKEQVLSALAGATVAGALMLYLLHSWGLVVGAFVVAAIKVRGYYHIDLKENLDAFMWREWDAHLCDQAREQVLDENPFVQDRREMEHVDHDVKLGVHHHFLRTMSTEELLSPDFRKRLAASEHWESPSDRLLRRLVQRKLALQYAAARWHAPEDLFEEAPEDDSEDVDEGQDS